MTVVHAPGCHFCDDAEQAVLAMGERYPVDLRLVEVTSPVGLALLAAYRPGMNPLVLVDDAFFSSGRLPRRKLEAFLHERAARPFVGAAG